MRKELPIPLSLIQTFWLACLLKAVGALVGVLSGVLAAKSVYFDRWILAWVDSLLMVVILSGWWYWRVRNPAAMGNLGWEHRLLRGLLAIAILLPAFDVIASTWIQYYDTHNLFLREYGWTFEQVSEIYALGGLFVFLPVVLAVWQYEWHGLLGGLCWAGVTYLLLPLFLPPNTFTIWLYWVRGFVQLGVLLIIALTTLSLTRTQRQEAQSLASANAQLAQFALTAEQLATTQERNRMAQELHDTLAHSLAAISIQLQAVGTLLPIDPPQAQNELRVAQKQVQDSFQDSRRAIRALRASLLEELGLVGALQTVLQQVSERCGAVGKCDISPQLPALPATVEQAIYRIAQSALANVERHAQAGVVRLAVQWDEPQLLVEIEDDGVGFLLEQVAVHTQFGLQLMEERALAIGAHLTVRSAPNQGTTIRLRYLPPP
ncbi:MAG TPA: sensor histidine kinase [Anaerolineales bacterium]|nr:sensor histidine kinase [Anaerolineales bacterium]